MSYESDGPANTVNILDSVRSSTSHNRVSNANENSRLQVEPSKDGLDQALTIWKLLTATTTRTT